MTLRHSTVDGVRFYTSPEVYLVGQTQFNTHEFDRFLDDQEMDINTEQFAGSPGEQLVESGARACYMSFGSGRPTAEHLENIRASNHGSVVRHSTATLMITGVSRGLTHELVRHGAGTAISQSSSRYIPARKLGFVVPPEVQGDAVLENAFQAHCLTALTQYEMAVGRLTDKLVQGHPQDSKTAARKTARGAARAWLPIGLAQVIQFTFNIQSFRHVLRMRGSSGAEKEIIKLAQLMAPVAKHLWPHLCDDVVVLPTGGVKLKQEI